MRKAKNDYYLGIAREAASRSTCLKRRYGCVIVNDDEIVSTGYNGAPRGEENCCDIGICKRLNKPSNSGDYSDCHSVHAEQNALISAARREMIGATMYLWGDESYREWDIKNGKPVVGTERGWSEIEHPHPCPICMRMIKNAGIAKIVTRDGELEC